MMNQYVHVRCDQYSLLVDIRWVKEVINTADKQHTESSIDWRNNKIPFLDLTHVLMGHKNTNNRHCIVLKGSVDEKQFLGIGVGQVLNIEKINDAEFSELPSLDFPFNDYFDKVFIASSSNACIYRLKNLVLLQQE